MQVPQSTKSESQRSQPQVTAETVSAIHEARDYPPEQGQESHNRNVASNDKTLIRLREEQESTGGVVVLPAKPIRKSDPL